MAQMVIHKAKNQINMIQLRQRELQTISLHQIQTFRYTVTILTASFEGQIYVMNFTIFFKEIKQFKQNEKWLHMNFCDVKRTIHSGDTCFVRPSHSSLLVGHQSPQRKQNKQSCRAWQREDQTLNSLDQRSFFIPLLQKLAWCPGLGQQFLSAIEA